MYPFGQKMYPFGQKMYPFGQNSDIIGRQGEIVLYNLRWQQELLNLVERQDANLWG